MSKSRDQDLFYFFSGMNENYKSRHFLAEKFKENYDAVRYSVTQSMLQLICIPAAVRAADG